MISAVMFSSTSIPEKDLGNFANPMLQKIKKKRNLPGNPDPDAEVVALSPESLLATNKFVCEICNKGFKRDQNLQLHRRGHNLPWKLKKKINETEVIKKRVYVCPEPKCVHHHPSRALGDLTGIKKHFCRKHNVEKKWKCEKCNKIYAVQSDWKAHIKICENREYRCNCGTLFPRKDSFTAHKALCDALAQENAQRLFASTNSFFTAPTQTPQPPSLFPIFRQNFAGPWDPQSQNPNLNYSNVQIIKHEFPHHNIVPISSPLSATALLQKAATVGAGTSQVGSSTMTHLDMAAWEMKSPDRVTRDFLGLYKDHSGGGDVYDRDRH
ncbi:hypothetical protein ACJIZ3_011784 [Penstemon smallii]|uniref:C2H2-type domain-containing protein n=1 Tax=Penstemon smallii TaxID=265156 RepID=A0ABD3UK70_9LAMI